MILEHPSDDELRALLRAVPDITAFRLDKTHWLITRDERERSIVNARVATAAKVQQRPRGQRTWIVFGIGITVGVSVVGLVAIGYDRLR